jgi:transposase
MPGRKRSIELPGHDRETLERWIAAGTTPQRVVIRSRIVLLTWKGLTSRLIAAQLGITRKTVDLWCKRYLQGGCNALTHDRVGRGRKPWKAKS